MSVLVIIELQGRGEAVTRLDTFERAVAMFVLVEIERGPYGSSQGRGAPGGMEATAAARHPFVINEVLADVMEDNWGDAVINHRKEVFAYGLHGHFWVALRGRIDAGESVHNQDGDALPCQPIHENLEAIRVADNTLTRTKYISVGQRVAQSKPATQGVDSIVSEPAVRVILVPIGENRWRTFHAKPLTPRNQTEAQVQAKHRLAAATNATEQGYGVGRNVFVNDPGGRGGNGIVQATRYNPRGRRNFDGRSGYAQVIPRKRWRIIPDVGWGILLKYISNSLDCGRVDAVCRGREDRSMLLGLIFALSMTDRCADRQLVYWQHYERREFTATFAGMDFCWEGDAAYLCPTYDRMVVDVARQPNHSDIMPVAGVPCVHMPDPALGEVIGWELPLEAWDIE